VLPESAHHIVDVVLVAIRCVEPGLVDGSNEATGLVGDDPAQLVVNGRRIAPDVFATRSVTRALPPIGRCEQCDANTW
jgi:hypothetical protein